MNYFRIAVVTTLFFTLTVVSVSANIGTITGDNIISGVVKKESGSNYYYISFGDYSKFSYYSQLVKYLGSQKPENLQQDINSIGQHMTINQSNLLPGYTLNSIVGKAYSFAIQTGFTDFGENKTWYVKVLVPLGDAAKIFDGTYYASLHTSVGYYYSNTDSIPFKQYKKAM